MTNPHFRRASVCKVAVAERWPYIYLEYLSEECVTQELFSE